MPKGGYMSGIFGSSPVSPLQIHMSKVFACASELIPFIEAAISNDWDAATRIQQNISGLEREADDLKKELRLNLPKGLFMPVSRQDLLEVLLMQDKIANKSKDIAGVIVGRRVQFPEVVQQDFKQFVQRCIDACAQAQDAVNQMDELVETGFSGQEIKIVTGMITELDTIESDTDRLQADIRHKIFAIEKDLPPVDVMFLYKIIESTGDVADRAQNVGSRLQLMLAR